MKRSSLFALASAAALTVSGCNMFGFMDSPSGDAQLISAARACLNRGDYACALSNYQKVSSAQSDVALSEQAMVVFDQQGASMSSFIGMSSESTGGGGISKLAEGMTSGAGQAKRMAIYNAYKSADTITDTDLKNFVKFLGATALSAEILAEAAGADGILAKTDIVQNASCTAAGGACLGDTACDPANAALGLANSGDIDSNPPNTANATSDQLYWAFKKASQAFSNLGSGGPLASIKSAVEQFTSSPAPAGNPLADECFRGILLDQGIGR